MKVLYICALPEMYGDNIALLSLMRQLVKNGIEPYFFVKDKGPLTEIFDKERYKYITGYDVYKPGMWPQPKDLHAVLGLIRRCLFVYNKEYKRLREEVRNISPDVIHSNLSCTTLGYSLAKDLNIPHVWHVREYGDLDHGFRQFPSKAWLQKKLSDSINKTIFITDDIYKYYGSPSNGCAIYDGVIKNSMTKPNIKNFDKSYFLYVGRLTKTKGVHSLLQTYFKYTELCDKPLPIKIAGRGRPEFEVELKGLCYNHINGHLVEFLGYRNDISELMSEARALIVPSRFEAFGFISVEAMYNGCPVIGHNVAGTKCQFDNGVLYAGREIGFRYNDESELFRCLQRLTNCSRIDLMPMLSAAQNTVLYYYTAERSANRVMDIYKSLKNEKILIQAN